MTLPVKPLPKYLVQRYKGWKATDFEENHSWYHRLAEEGQRPRVMVISCCDSRVHVTSIFGAEMGEFFIHRNIANLVPPYKPDGDLHGTSAALEYAVTSLKVSNIIVLGHSHCGGVEGGLAMAEGRAPELLENSSFVGSWMRLLEPGYKAVADIPDQQDRQDALEKQAILVSLRNLVTFPFVTSGLEDTSLALHGLWHDIGTGALEAYDPERDAFSRV
ncbi:carbonic anhydrase [Oceanibium sediminis]|uniref:carbonic anhydrase n=1 Tax=Oceanibium sediminis TaxID=2026339 RepID=UPI000DD4A530|nr:carbonic anhydrase [Oceanibium sediminis]